RDELGAAPELHFPRQRGVLLEGPLATDFRKPAVEEFDHAAVEARPHATDATQFPALIVHAEDEGAEHVLSVPLADGDPADHAVDRLQRLDLLPHARALSDEVPRVLALRD